ncbi:MAG TPA: nucleoside hydrolase [Gaiellaceae bacterium]|nr:nucleoside hydrolase [Gaiellaceae bacterium]
MPRPFLIDTDTASDDAVALLLALRRPDVDVRAITVVAGNVPVDQGVQNALYTVELAGADVPVFRGAAAPRERALHTGQSVHGEDGMGDIGLPLAGRAAAPGDAAEAICERADGATLVTLGPLTNVAAAFERDPELARRLESVVVMGGTSDHRGNITAVAEYNVWADPEAAAIVFASGVPLTMVGWDISRTSAVVTPRDAEELRALGPLGEFAVDIQRTLVEFCRTQTLLDGFDLPDPIATAIAIDRSVATDVRRLHVAVETAGELTRGETVVDYRGTSAPANADVVLAASRDRFFALLRDALRS